jgi:DNA-binding IclR family transcriptional regulator
MPVHISSAGLALMAHQDKALQGLYLEQFADPDGRVTADAVRELLGETARQGYAQLKGVVDPDTWGIAVPVLNRRQRAVASLGVVVPLREMRLQALVPALQTAARGIARHLPDS